MRNSDFTLVFLLRPWYTDFINTVFEQVYTAVRAVPHGRVTTYGQIALLLGSPRLARAAGYALHRAPDDVPCHRVVNRCGELSDAFAPSGKETHRLLLEIAGVSFTADGTVDLSRHMWYGNKEESQT